MVMKGFLHESGEEGLLFSIMGEGVSTESIVQSLVDMEDMLELVGRDD